MRLVWFILHGYKRFEERTDVHLDSRLIAITGPNEAGKSSLLDALVHLNEDGRIPSQELTRRSRIPDEQVILRARFLLQPDDVAAISDLHGGRDARWLIVEKRQSGELFTGIEPRLTRDLTPRRRAVGTLQALAVRLERAEARSKPVTDEVESAVDGGEEEYEPLAFTEVEELVEALDVEDENLSAATLSRLAGVVNKLETEAAAYGRAGKRALETAEPLVAEEEDHPNTLARYRLGRRRPRFLPYKEAERTLGTQYDIVSEVPSLPDTAALRNLAALGDFDLDEVGAAVQEGDVGLVDTLTRQANDRLAERFRLSWRQSEITVRFRIDETALRLLIETPHEPSSRIDERSDGMRAFVALLAYTAVNAEGPAPVLLIDEAELHLHYAAQADLVQVLTEQTAAAQVIYTTHSAGCLPEDLGTGVRLVTPLGEGDRSRVVNWFWEDEPGFGPLLHGMGYAAGAFAFTPARFAVFAEGATELVLLPALLREATRRRTLDFQVAPGLALVNRETASNLELEAARVKYVVDSDQGGRDIKAVLRDGGVNPDDIFELRDGEEGGLTVEDFVDSVAYQLAINEELRRSGHPDHQLARKDIPDRGRVAHVQAWAEERGFPEPNKVRVAARVVELRCDRRVTSASRSKALRTLYVSLRKSLGIDDAIEAGARL